MKLGFKKLENGFFLIVGPLFYFTYIKNMKVNRRPRSWVLGLICTNYKEANWLLRI